MCLWKTRKNVQRIYLKCKNGDLRLLHLAVWGWNLYVDPVSKTTTLETCTCADNIVNIEFLPQMGSEPVLVAAVMRRKLEYQDRVKNDTEYRLFRNMQGNVEEMKLYCSANDNVIVPVMIANVGNGQDIGRRPQISLITKHSVCE